MTKSSNGRPCPPLKNRFLRQAALWAALFGLLASPLLNAQNTDPASQYRVLEWKELVPEGWEPPVVPEAFDEVDASSVDPASVVSELDRQLVALPGFMKPVVFEGNQVSEFLLVPFLPHHTRQHAHLDANQMVYVYTHEPVEVDNPMAPLWVVGTIKLEPVLTDEGPAAYRIVDAVTTDYEY